jgi:hypothetical protein
MESFKIHIFCLKKELCRLIIKKLSSDGCIASCTNLSDSERIFPDNFDYSIDCIILDKDISRSIRDEIQAKFPDLPIICLPSLDSDTGEKSGITYISEPLKLSELSEKIREIRLKKEIESKR